MFHVWMGPLPGGLAIGTVILMVAISAMGIHDDAGALLPPAGALRGLEQRVRQAT